MGLTEMSEVEAEIAALSGLATDRLRIEWRRLYRTEPPPRLSRDLLLRAVAYKIHERAHALAVSSEPLSVWISGN